MKAESEAVRCTYCGKKVAEALEGKLVVTCRGCKNVATIQREPKVKTSRLTG